MLIFYTFPPKQLNLDFQIDPVLFLFCFCINLFWLFTLLFLSSSYSPYSKLLN